MFGWKIFVIIGFATLLIFSIGKAVTAIYNSGYDKARFETQQQAITDQTAAIEKARVNWKLTHEAALAEAKSEQVIVEKIRVIEKKIPIVVSEIVEIKPECADLGPDFLGLFNDAITAGSN